MIIRLWTALTTEDDQHKYYEHFREHVLPALRSLDGYLGATLNTLSSEDGVEILVLTRWRSVEAVRAFAGADAQQAVVAEEAALVLTRWDRRAKHFDIIIEDAAD